MKPDIQSFFDEASFTITYLVSDPATKRAAIIDPVLDYNDKRARTSTDSADRVLEAAAGMKVNWILETHAHAEHLTASAYLQQRTGAKIAIGKEIVQTQKFFGAMFNAKDVLGDGAPFDRLLSDGEKLPLGDFEIEVLHTPGHTAGCVSYKIGGNIFIGDTMFMPDYGTARTDFPGGDARALYHSIQRLFAYPPETVLWLCHDYLPPGRTEFQWKTTVAEQRAKNILVHDGVSEEEFVVTRKARDKPLAPPALILPSIQVNIRAGRMPPPEDDGKIYLKLPVNRI
ncbi:MAG TPA: MBL fold metallo-hydrolase [Rhizomicrobium sp.]|nr:MBL fold metallo-hydrolase [Rhizomicrobium sp.]